MIRPAACNAHQVRLCVEGFDVNISALHSVSVTLTGKLIAPPRTNSSSQDGSLALTASVPDPCGTNTCNLTMTGSLGVLHHRHLPAATY